MAADVVPGGTARAERRLTGGIESAAHAVELVHAGGAVTAAVLKRRPDPRFDGANEWAALRTATAAAVPTPQPLGFDPDKRWFGIPALVMSRLRGRSRMDVVGERGAAARIAAALAAVHDCAGEGLEPARPRWRRSCPAEASDFERRVWREIGRRAPEAGPAASLVHLDFHPGAVLWLRGRVSGIIDWENGARGWPAEDLAKCRAYVALINGPVAADALRAAYEAEIGGPVRDLALAELAYNVGVWPQADRRAYVMSRTGFPAVTGDDIRYVSQRLIEAAMRNSPA